MKYLVPVLCALAAPLLTYKIANAGSVQQINSFSFPFSIQQLPLISHKPGQGEMVSELSGTWVVETVPLNQPLILNSGRHQVSPELNFRPERIKLTRDSSLLGVNLGNVEESVPLVEIYDSAFIELAINDTALCDSPQRQAIPELAQIILYSGKLVWNGCGQVYWPGHIQPKRSGQSWHLVTTPAEAISVEENPTLTSTATPLINSTFTPDDTNQNSTSGLSTGQVTGIVIGAVVVIFVAGALYAAAATVR